MANPYESLFAPSESAAPPPSAANPYASLFGDAAAPAVEGAAAPQQDKYTLGEVPGAAIRNFVPSVTEHVTNVAKAFGDDPMKFLLGLAPSHKHKLDMINHLTDQFSRSSSDTSNDTICPHLPDNR